MKNSISRKQPILVLMGLVLLLAMGGVWLSFRQHDEPTAPLPTRGPSSDNSPTLARALESEIATHSTRSSDTSPVSSEQQPPHHPPRPLGDVFLEPLELVFQEYEQQPSWHVAQRLLIEYIKVDLDSKGKFEDRTGITDATPYPPHDPDRGFFDSTGRRGTRWYRFTRQEYPEWFDLISPPASDSVTGRQDGIAEPTKLSPELAGRIRTLAAAAIEIHRTR